MGMYHTHGGRNLYRQTHSPVTVPRLPDAFFPRQSRRRLLVPLVPLMTRIAQPTYIAAEVRHMGDPSLTSAVSDLCS